MDSRHIPMLGFLMSRKYLYPEPTRDLKRLIEPARGKALNMIHFYAEVPEQVAGDVEKIFFGMYPDINENLYESGLCRAVQLNAVSWLDSREVKRIKERFPEMQIVLQISRQMMGDLSAVDIARRTQEYNESSSYILIDPSGGEGRDFDLKRSVEIYNTLSMQMRNVTFGFAGGFTGENSFSKTQALTDKICNCDICIDAQKGVRRQIGEMNCLDISKVLNYLSGVKDGLYGFEEQ